MVQKTLLLVATCVALGTASVHADLVDATFRWEGDSGFVVSGNIRYDDAINPVVGSGFGATTGLDFLDLSVFDPADTLLFSTTNVSGGNSDYQYLNVSIDTVAQVISAGSTFDIGDDSLAGDPNEYFLFGTVGSSIVLFNGQSATIDRNSGDVAFTSSAPVPEPAALGLVGAAVALSALRRRRQVSG